MSEQQDNRKNKSKPPEPTGRSSHLFLWVITLVVIILLFYTILDNPGDDKFLGYQHYLTMIENGEVEKVEVIKKPLEASKMLFYFKDKKTPRKEFNSKGEDYEMQVAEALKKVYAPTGQPVPYQVIDPPFTIGSILPYLPAVILLVLFFFLFTRMFRAPGGTGSVLSFGKSRAKLANKESSKNTFADVAGMEEAKDEVKEIIDFLKNPERFQRLGGRVPRGVILVGPPGTGKTLLAKAIAGEAEVPFFSICGSDFVEMFVGVGASRVRDLFKQARENSPCILFLDEVDAVGRKRGSGLGGGHDEREQTLNAILVEMDGFESDEGVIVIASTNRPDVLDPALLRPGRFDRQISIDLPDLKGREEILKVHLRKVKCEPDMDVNRVARATPSFSGAELEAIVNEAAIQAAMKDKEHVTVSELEEARDKIRWGREKRSIVVQEEDRQITAYHEAGHAFLAHVLPEVEPLHKVTIIPRGMALGATMQLPEHDRYHLMKKRILGDVCVCYAGRIAEELFCDDVTSGAREDIRRATQLLRLLVCEFGMSEKLGPVNYQDSEEHLFLGREIARHHTHSEKMNEEIDKEVRRLADDCYQKTVSMLKNEKDAVASIAAALLERETLSGEEVAEIVNNGPAEKEAGNGGETAQNEEEPAPDAG